MDVMNGLPTLEVSLTASGCCGPDISTDQVDAAAWMQMEFWHGNRMRKDPIEVEKHARLLRLEFLPRLFVFENNEQRDVSHPLADVLVDVARREATRRLAANDLAESAS